MAIGCLTRLIHIRIIRRCIMHRLGFTAIGITDITRPIIGITDIILIRVIIMGGIVAARTRRFHAVPINAVI